MTNPMQPLDPQNAPDPVTPQAAPSDPAGYASVTPHGQGTAPYDIQAPMEDLTAATAAARELTGGGEGAPTGAGLTDVMSPRQAASKVLLESPAGFSVGSGTSGYDIQQGFSGQGNADYGWPNDIGPGILETPDQGQMGTYPPNTGTD